MAGTKGSEQAASAKWTSDTTMNLTYAIIDVGDAVHVCPYQPRGIIQDWDAVSNRMKQKGFDFTVAHLMRRWYGEINPALIRAENFALKTVTRSVKGPAPDNHLITKADSTFAPRTVLRDGIRTPCASSTPIMIALPKAKSSTIRRTVPPTSVLNASVATLAIDSNGRAHVRSARKLSSVASRSLFRVLDANVSRFPEFALRKSKSASPTGVFKVARPLEFVKNLARPPFGSLTACGPGSTSRGKHKKRPAIGKFKIARASTSGNSRSAPSQPRFSVRSFESSRLERFLDRYEELRVTGQGLSKDQRVHSLTQVASQHSSDMQKLDKQDDEADDDGDDDFTVMGDDETAVDDAETYVNEEELDSDGYLTPLSMRGLEI